jgi:alkylation response protein AidB-like acyl-CoA dehydrogenase
VPTQFTLTDIAASAGPDLPTPGSGRTWCRFDALARWAAFDLSLGRLAEGHVDALAILAEAGVSPVSPTAIYGVWAARNPHGAVRASHTAEGWRLTGQKPFCSGSGLIDRALVSAETDDGYRLFDISVAQHVVHVVPDSWPAIGMAGSLSDTLDFGGPPISDEQAIGGPEFYLARPGFWFGAIGVAACWYGGAKGLVSRLSEALGTKPSDLALVELGYAIAHVGVMRDILTNAARAIDDDPNDSKGEGQRRAMVVRHGVHHAATEVLRHAAAAGGARPLCHDREQARRSADLYVYLAQHHGPQEALELGRLARKGTEWL